MYIHNFAATLKDEMKRRNMSLLAYADFLNVGKTTLQDYLRGDGNPRLNTLILIAGRLELSLGELLFRGQKIHTYGRTALNALPDEIMELHPQVRDAARRQFLALQAVYDLSDRLTAAEPREDTPP